VRNVPDDQDLQATFIFSRALQLVGGGIARDRERWQTRERTKARIRQHLLQHHLL
jgi:hypothetical protein